MQGHSILDVAKITGYLGKWSIDEDGTLMAVKVITDEIITKKLAVSEQATFGTGVKPIGITIYDEITGNPYCVKVKNGIMVNDAGACDAGGSIVAPASAPTPAPPSAETPVPPDTATATSSSSDAATSTLPDLPSPPASPAASSTPPEPILTVPPPETAPATPASSATTTLQNP